MNKKTIIGLVLLIGFGSLLFMNFGKQVGGYMNFAEAASTGAQAHVVGTWVKEQAFAYDQQANVFSFHMKDQNGKVIKVVYNNLKPANFEDAEQVVVEGKMLADGQFEAKHILVKCPSKYNEQAKPYLSGTEHPHNQAKPNV